MKGNVPCIYGIVKDICIENITMDRKEFYNGASRAFISTITYWRKSTLRCSLKPNTECKGKRIRASSAFEIYRIWFAHALSLCAALGPMVAMWCDLRDIGLEAGRY